MSHALCISFCKWDCFPSVVCHFCRDFMVSDTLTVRILLKVSFPRDTFHSLPGTWEHCWSRIIFKSILSVV